MAKIMIERQKRNHREREREIKERKDITGVRI
jgi:hypothetical protein